MISSIVMASHAASRSGRIATRYIGCGGAVAGKARNLRWSAGVTLRAASGTLRSRCGGGPRQAGVRSVGVSVSCEPGGRQSRLRRRCRAEPVSVRRQRAREEFVDHLGAGLRALAERDRGLRADRAGVGLPVAEAAHVGHRGRAAATASRGTDARCRRALGCDPPLGSSTSTMLSQNATRSRKNMTLPCSPPRSLPLCVATLAGRLESAGST